MLFNSWSYLLLYIVIAIPLYWTIPRTWRVHFIWIMSLAFYSFWRWDFSLLMVAAAAVDYYAAKNIFKSQTLKEKKFWLLLTIVFNLGILLFFKYTYFIFDNFRSIAALFGSKLPSLQEMGVHIILPLGISFFVFQTINYSIDVYRNVIKPTDRFTTFLAYVTFWPHLMAGPILRASHVLPQLEAEKSRNLTLENVTSGLMLISTGLFKKVLIADIIAPKVDAAFLIETARLSAFDVWIAAFLFGFQIYFDFAGYSDMAIGSDRLLGIHLPDNFNWPYMSKSPREFWQRWHISLSTWIRDYLYLPLTGQKYIPHSSRSLAESENSSSRPSHRTAALFTTWFIMGLWHGAGWDFVFWGLYHAGLIYLYRTFKILKTLEHKLPLLAWAIMLCLSMLAWIPFRATSLTQALEMLWIVIQPAKYVINQRMIQGYAYTIVPALCVAMVTCWFAHLGIEKIKNKKTLTLSVSSALYFFTGLLISFFMLIYLKPVRQFVYFVF